jgi:hypothetical protein
MKRPLLATSLLAAVEVGHAANYCVANEEELRAALDAAQVTLEPDHVRIRAVAIDLTQSLTFSPQGGSTGPLVVTGGWDVGCSSRRFGAQWTRLEAAAPKVHIELAPDDDLTVSDLHAIGFAGILFRNPTIGPALTTLRVSRVGIFHDTFAGHALGLFSDAERIEVDNLLVDAPAVCGIAAATFSGVGQLIVRSSTVVVREAPQFTNGGAAICFDGVANAELNASINSVFSSSDGTDLLVNGRPVLMLGSAYSDVSGLPNPLDPDSADNLVMPLSFEVMASDPLARFTRIAQSTALMPALVDSGVAQNVLQYPYDVLGNPRGLGLTIDRGAFELANYGLLFRNGFEGS